MYSGTYWNTRGEIYYLVQVADTGFYVRGVFKKIVPSGGRRKFFLGYFVWKITILRQKIIFFPILGGGTRRVLPPGSAPGNWLCSTRILLLFCTAITMEQAHYLVQIRYDNVTFIPLVLQLGLRIGPIQRMGANYNFSQYFNFLFAYLVITYYSLQFLSNGDTK